MESKGLLRPLMLAAVVATGFTIVWGILSSWSAEVLVHVLGPERVTEHLRIQQDGTPLITINTGQRLAFRDLDANPVLLPDNEIERASLVETALAPTLPEEPGTGQSLWEQGLRCFRDDGEP